jgi:hypothetical protein
MLALAMLQDASTPFQGIDDTQTMTTVYFTATASGDYAAGGDTLDFTQIAEKIKSSRPPLWVEFQSQDPDGVSGWLYQYRPGTTAANGKMQVMGTGAGNAQVLGELAAGNYPASVTGDRIVGKAAFPRV